MIITKENPLWHAALEFAEKWRPGHRCTGMGLPTDWFSKCGYCGTVEESKDGKLPLHDEPPPDITPDLLYAILEAGQKIEPQFVGIVDDTMMDKYGNHKIPLADAIIRAAASLQEAK